MYPDAGTTGSVLSPGLPPTRRRLAQASIAGIGVLVVAVATRYLYQLISDPAVIAGWWIGVATLAFRVYALARQTRLRHRPMITGRIVAIVTAHEPETTDLHACVWSILDQRGVTVHEVHVVDDGSTAHPVRPFAHPRVRWHRTRTGGRHAACGYVLDRLEEDAWDFVLIVDAGCLLDERSVARQLRAFSRPRVTAATGTVVARNGRQNPLARIAGLTVAASAVPSCRPEMMPARPALYRARIAFADRRRLLTLYGHDDDRRLLLYAAGEGEVVAVNGAIASARVAADVGTAYRHRLDEATSWWRTVPLALAGGDRPPGTVRRLLALLHLVIAPLTIGYALVSLVAGARWAALALYAALFLLVRYTATSPVRHREPWTWLLLMPAEALWTAAFVVPVKYVALARLCVRDRGAAPSVSSVAPPGTVYYSGYLPDGNGS